MKDKSKNESPKRTPEEQQLLYDTGKLWDRPLTDQEQNLVIDQAVSIGDLPDHENETKPKRTPEQQAVVDVVARSRGKEWAEEHADLIIDEAEAYGFL